uniref:ABC-type xenobiotic transporter n=1 Tax=Strongyloides venezuelensis TaxID=75913 RepID=A0A0K0FAJ5_STRVS
MRYGSKVDWILLCLGISLAVISGIIQPFENILSAHYYEIFGNGYKEYRDNKIMFNPRSIEKNVFSLVYRQIFLNIGIFFTMTLSTTFFYLLTERQIKTLKVRYIRSILKQDGNWFEKNPPGKLSSSMSSIFEKIRYGFNPKLTVFLSTISFTVSSLAISTYFSYKMGLVLFAGVSGAIIPLGIGITIYNRYSNKEYEMSGEIGSVIEEIFSGIRTVMSFNGQDFEIKRYTSMVDNTIKLSRKKVIILTTTYSIYTFIVHSEYFLTLFVGYDLVKSEIITFGIIMTVISCIFGCVMRLDELVYQIGKLSEGLEQLENVINIIDLKPDVDYLNNDGMIIEKFKGRVTFENVSFSYQSRPEKLAVNCINFKIEAGETCALVGYSGGGKSTIFNLLLRYYSLKSGEIYIDDIPHKKINLKWLRDNTSVVFQEPILFTGTIKENILIGKPDATDDEIIDACRIAYAEKFIKLLPNNYDTLIGEGGIKLSGGMKQRICIARAVIRNPKILVLDEATSALDVSSEKKVLKALSNASKGRTTLAISHKIKSIKSYDKIIVLDNGQIVECGKHDVLINQKGLYYKLAMCENQAIKNDSNSRRIRKSSYFQDSVTISRKSKSKSTMISTINNNSYNKSTTQSTKTLNSSKNSQESNPKKSFISFKSQHSKRSKIKYKVKGSNIRSRKSCSDILHMLKYFINEKKSILIGIVFVIINGLQMPISVFTTAYIMDMFTKPLDDIETKKQYTSSIVIYITLAIIYGLSYCACGHIFGFCGINISKKMRIQAYKNILYQKLVFFENKKNDPGKLTNILTTDALNINQGIDLTFIDALIGAISFVFSTGIAYYFNPIIASIGIVVLITFFGISNIITFIIGLLNKKSYLVSKKSVSIGLESINNVKTIQAFTRIEEMIEKYEFYLNKSYNYLIYSGILTSISFSIGYSLFGLSTIISVIVGSKLIIKYDINPYHIIQCIDALSYACFSLFYIYPYVPDYIPFRKAMSHLFQYINKKTPLEKSNGSKKEIYGDVEMVNGYFSYPNSPDHIILKNINFKVNFGESLAFVGHSGSGKSTILQLLERHYCLLDGSLEVDGTNVKEFNLQHYRNNISIVSQEPVLFNLSIKENICYGLYNVSDERIEKVLEECNIDEFIKLLPNGINTSCGSKGKQLSGGQKQRIAIARALIRNPKILLLDEATSALDTKSEYLVKEALERVCRNKTTIIVAHKLSTIQHCNCIVVINNGVILERGTHEELIEKQGEYYKLINCQAMED